MEKIAILTVPQLGVNDDRVKVVSWSVTEGGTCSAGQVVCELETTKAIQEVEADSTGYIVPVVFTGEEVMVSQPLALIGNNLGLLLAERDVLRKNLAGTTTTVRVKAITSKARRVADELGVDVEALSHEVADGVVRESDVRSAYQKRLASAVEVPQQFTVSEGRLPIAIYGAGAGGITIKEAVDLGNKFDVVCFLDDALDRAATHCGLPTFHSDQLNKLLAAGVHGIAIAIASGNIRSRILIQLEKICFPVVTVIHPQTFISPTATIGRGCFIKAGAIVETKTSIGDLCIIDNGVIVAHDNKISPAVHLAPGVVTGGYVQIGAKTIVGTGSSIATGTVIGENCIVSVGTAVTRDIPDNSVIEGVPGKIIGARKY